jgi:hypothetical protein
MDTLTRPAVPTSRLAPVAAGAVLLGGCVALAVVDPAAGPTICPFKLATGLDCPGCGGTRAAHSLVRGDMIGALDANVLAVLALPLIAWGLFTWLTRAFGGPRLRTFTPSPVLTTLGVVVLVAFWVVRNLSGAPFDWLNSGT